MSTAKKQTKLTIVTKSGSIETTTESLADLEKRLKAKTYTEPDGDEKFWFCQRLQDGGEELIDRKFKGLKLISVKFIFKDKATPKAMGKCKKMSEMDTLLTGIKFLIWVAWDTWTAMTDHQREALLFHELSHIGFDEDGNLAVIPHDVEMFITELQQYGTWTASLTKLVAATKQLDLFGEPAK